MMPFKFSKTVLIFLLLFVALLLGGVYIYFKKKKEELFVPQSVITQEESLSLNTNFFFDLESTDGLVGIDNIKQGIAHSGTTSCDLSGGKEYGFSIIKKIGDAGRFPIKRVSASVWIYPLMENPNVVLTATVSSPKGESVFWDGKSTEKMNLPTGKWTKINAAYNLPVEKLTPDDVLQINIWNKGKTDVLVDDMEVVYGESNERRGEYSRIDANTFYEKRFVSQRNKPPFPTVYCKKQEINNNNTTQLVPDNNDSDLSPNDEFLSGDFISDKNNLDELLCIKKGKLLLFAYDPGRTVFEFRFAIAHPHEQSLWDKNTKKFAGDFNADGRTDVLIVNTGNKFWNLVELKNKEWNTISSGSISTEMSRLLEHGEGFVSKLFSGKKDAMLINDSSGFRMFQLNTTLDGFDETAVNRNPSDSILFKGSPVFYSGNFTGDGKPQLLRYDVEWRFDLKLLDVASDGFTISGIVDFKGYEKDCNPKYYEFLKIVPGRFISSDKTSLLTILRNCKDQDFNGTFCNEFENAGYLPNSIQLYSFGN